MLETVNSALEGKRNEKLIGSGLEASVEVAVAAEALAAFDGVVPQDVFRTSAASLSSGDVSVVVLRAPGHKCERCWKVLPEVAPPKMLCERCDDAVTHIDAGT